MNKLLNIKRLLLLLFILFFRTSFSQIEFSTIEKFDLTINDSILKNWVNPNKSGVIFFCPISKKNTSDIFNKKGLDQISSRDFKNTNRMTYFLACFISDNLNNSKNPVIQNSKSHNNYLIEKLECLIVNPDLRLLNRASVKLNNNFTSSEFLGIENVFKIDIVDKGKCIKDPLDVLGFYSQYVSEVFSPKYSNDEKIEMLKDSINNLRKEIKKIKIEQDKKFENLFKEVQDLKQQNIKLKNEKAQPK